MIDKLTVVDCNGEKYLCEIDESKDRVVLSNACLVEERSLLPAMREWIKKHNIEELQSICLGMNTGYGIDPLNQKQKIQFRHLWNGMQEVKRMALHRLENQYFTEDEE